MTPSDLMCTELLFQITFSSALELLLLRSEIKKELRKDRRENTTPAFVREQFSRVYLKHINMLQKACLSESVWFFTGQKEFKTFHSLALHKAYCVEEL